MQQPRFPQLTPLLIPIAIFFIFAGNSVKAEVTAQGIFSTLWGDSFTAELPPQSRHFLTDRTGASSKLIIDQDLAERHGGLLSFNGRMVSITYQERLSPGQPRSTNPPEIQVTHLELLQPDTRRNTAEPLATGSQPWVTVMCKFNDVAAEPKPLNYFQDMYSSSYPGMDHYWREASYNRVNISGSTAHGWFQLPHPEAYYNPSDTQGGTDLTLLMNDCIAAADSIVDYSSFAGINMMFNTNFDNGYAWGGGQYLSLDGVTKLFRVTWEPPWGYNSITVIAHEMGHGFGMPHSSGNYGATYDNAWDVMSDAWSNCGASTHATYGCLGQQTIGYHRDLVGWLQAGEKFIFDGTTRIITLEQLTQPASSNYLLAIIPINGSSTNYYTVEVRNRIGYDTKLVSDAVIIHEVDTSRSRPAYIVDIDNNGDTADGGAIWDVGETFFDGDNNICVRIVAKTGSSYTVQIGCSARPSGQSLAPIHLLLR